MLELFMLAGKGGGSGRLRAVYDLDGIDDYILIPAEPLAAGETVKLKFRATAPVTVFTAMISDGNALAFVEINSNAQVLQVAASAGSATLDGVLIVTGVTPFPADGIEHAIIYTKSGTSSSLVEIGGRGGARLCSFPIYDVEVGNRFFPINDGFAVNPVIADSLEPAFPELWVDPATLGGQWVDEGGGQYSCAATGISNLTGSMSLTNGVTHLFTFEILSVSGGSITIVNSTQTFNTVGVHTAFVLPTIGQAIFSCATGVSASIKDLSAKETTAGEAMNFNAERWINV